MSKRYVGLQIDMKEGDKIGSIQLSEEAKKSLGLNEKSYQDYLKEFLNSKVDYKMAYKALDEGMVKSLPSDRKSKCKYCLGETKDESFKLCDKYFLQMKLTFCLAATEFVNIVLNNSHIYQDKIELQKLTQKFFECTQFVKDKGVIFFDLDKITKYCLSAGFLSLTKQFNDSDSLKNLRIINSSLDKLEQDELQNKVLDKQDLNYTDLQIEFFQKKQRFYKERLFIDTQKIPKSLSKLTNQSNAKPISIPKFALYYHYLQASKDFPHFENHPEGKMKAIEELIEKEQIETTPKYFQLKYNKIANYQSNRIAKNQANNIDYVANTMLKDYPKAQTIALEELKIAKNKI